MHEIEFTSLAIEHLDAVRPFVRNRILDEIEKQLTHQPTRATKRRQVIQGLVPPWDQAPPIWQLRVGDYRVFYDVDEDEQKVTIHAVLWKGRKTTGELL